MNLGRRPEERILGGRPEEAILEPSFLGRRDDGSAIKTRRALSHPERVGLTPPRAVDTVQCT